MGTWGTGLYSDDLAADLKTDLRELIGEGLSLDVAVERLSGDYASSLADGEEAPVFWLAIADAAWRLGRPHPQATSTALQIIEEGIDLRRWSSAKDRSRRAAILADLAGRLRSPAPAAKRIAKVIRANNAWTVGEVVSFRLSSGSFTAFRVIGHHVDKGGTHAVCEPLDWLDCDNAIPPDVAHLKVRESRAPWRVTQVMIGEPRRKSDLERFNRTGKISRPTQEPGRYTVIAFPHLDRWLSEIFGLE